MAKKSMKEVAKIMADMDICMLTTIKGRDITTSRPMSNNGDVRYDGKSYFFTDDKSKMVKDIKKNKHVSLSFAGRKRSKPLMISVVGDAKLVNDRSLMKEHWTKDLNIWFKDGIETPGIVMIQVHAKRIKYWHGNKEGEVKVASKK